MPTTRIARRRSAATSHRLMVPLCLLPWGLLLGVPAQAAEDAVPQFGVYQRSFQHAGEYENPYTQLTATAEFTEPDGARTPQIPLFWDGGATWRFRFSPDKTGEWTWRITSRDSISSTLAPAPQ